MTPLEWLNSLLLSKTLIPGVFKGQRVLHLQTPCDIHMTENVSKALFDHYEPEYEKGGILAAYPEKRDGKTLLIIKEVIFLKNISDNPGNSYLPANHEISITLKKAFDEQFLPITFHTHPTAHENPMMEIIYYISGSDTSKQDQLVSYNAVKVCNQSILFPHSLILALGKSKNRMFIGFYGGLIAPVEFETHKNEQMQKAMNIIFENISEWARKGNNKWWLIGGGLVFILLIIRYHRTALPLILLLAAMTPIFINDPCAKPKYFAQLTQGQVTIEIP